MSEKENQAHPTLDEAALFQKQPHLDHLAHSLLYSQCYSFSTGINPTLESGISPIPERHPGEGYLLNIGNH